jgi:hypothetical protein
MARQLLRRFLVLTCVAAVVALTPLSAQAQSEVTITVGATGTLQSRIVARVPVQITCAPMEVAFGDTGGTIRQAAGREIAHGSGGADQPVTSIVCDGAPHPASFTFVADLDSPPFRGGDAVVTVAVILCDVNFVCQSGDSGFQTVKLRPSS